MKHKENAESDSATSFYTHNIESGGGGVVAISKKNVSHNILSKIVVSHFS